jgi:glutamate-ammonia-ligase adenylyltransferase
VVQALATLAERRFQALHGRLAGSSWALVALGKCGGFELTAKSDLDLLFVYEIDDAVEGSDGPQPLPATQYCNKLAQHIIAVLGASDNDGALFATDFRLRPWGKKGPIATRLSALKTYFETEAWSYEHMAMTRARVISGPPQLSAAIEAVVLDIVRRSSERRTLRTDVLEMRSLLHAVKDTTNPWDIKYVRGGLVDVEFIAQYLMLQHAHEAGCPVRNGTAEALRALHAAGVLDRAHFDLLAAAHSYYTDTMQAVAAACTSGPLPDSMSRAFAAYLPAMMGEGSLAAMEATLCRLQAVVQDVFDELIGRLKP